MSTKSKAKPESRPVGKKESATSGAGKTDAQRKLGGQPESDKEAQEAGVRSATSSSRSK